MHCRVVKVRVDGIDLSNLHEEAGFFLKFPLRRMPDIFVILYIATGNAPRSLIYPASPTAQNDAIVVDHDNGYADHRILPENKVARWTHHALTVINDAAGKRCGATRTIVETA